MSRINIDNLWTGNADQPILAFRNQFSSATYSGTGIAGTAVAARSPFTYNFWEGEHTQALTADKGSAATFDYVALYYRDATFATGVNLAIDYYDGAIWTEILSDFALPAAEGCLIVVVPEVDDGTKIRATVGGGSGNSVKICNFKAGSLLSLPTGFPVGYEPGVLNLDVETTNVESEEGQILGSNIKRKGLNESLNFQSLPQDWVRSYWKPYVSELRREGVYFAWYPSGFSDDLVYGTLVGTPKVRYSSVVAQDITLNLRGPNNGA